MRRTRRTLEEVSCASRGRNLAGQTGVNTPETIQDGSHARDHMGNGDTCTRVGQKDHVYGVQEKGCRDQGCVGRGGGSLVQGDLEQVHQAEGVTSSDGKVGRHDAPRQALVPGYTHRQHPPSEPCLPSGNITHAGTTTCHVLGTCPQADRMH